MKQILGYVDCMTPGCEERATVRSVQKGGGHYLTTNCPCCKYSAATGAKVQSYLFHNTDWEPGVVVKRPPNVTDQPPKPATKAEPKPEPAKAETLPDFDPTVPEVTEPASKDTDEPEPKSRAGMVGTGLLVLALGLLGFGAAAAVKEQS